MLYNLSKLENMLKKLYNFSYAKGYESGYKKGSEEFIKKDEKVIEEYEKRIKE